MKLCIGYCLCVGYSQVKFLTRKEHGIFLLPSSVRYDSPVTKLVGILSLHTSLTEDKVIAENLQLFYQELFFK